MRAIELAKFGDVGRSILRGADLRPGEPDPATFPNRLSEAGRTLLGQAREAYCLAITTWHSDSRRLILWLLDHISAESVEGHSYGHSGLASSNP